MSTDVFLLIGRKKLKLLYCQNKIDIREYEHDNDAHIPFYFYSNNIPIYHTSTCYLELKNKLML